MNDLYNIIAELRTENEYLRLQTVPKKTASKTSDLANPNDIMRMETSLLRCDLAAAKSELLMSYK